MKAKKSMIISILILVVMFTCSSIAFAGHVYNTKVREVFIRSDGRGLVMLKDGTPNHPICQTYGDYIFAFSVNTEGGEAIYKLLLSARQSGAVVSIHGTGTCDCYDDSIAEDIGWVRLED